ncbi:MAG: hypothetical protein ACRCZH_02535 [Cetobacterium sp.]
MGHEYALRIEELNRELKEVKDKHCKLKLRTTTNLHKAIELQRHMTRIETEIACQRTLYFEFLDSIKKYGKFKNK